MKFFIFILLFFFIQTQLVYAQDNPCADDSDGCGTEPVKSLVLKMGDIVINPHTQPIRVQTARLYMEDAPATDAQGEPTTIEKITIPYEKSCILTPEDSFKAAQSTLNKQLKSMAEKVQENGILLKEQLKYDGITSSVFNEIITVINERAKKILSMFG